MYMCRCVCVCGVRVRVCVCVFALARRRVCLRVSVYVCVFAWLCVLKLESCSLLHARISVNIKIQGRAGSEGMKHKHVFLKVFSSTKGHFVGFCRLLRKKRSRLEFWTRPVGAVVRIAHSRRNNMGLLLCLEVCIWCVLSISHLVILDCLDPCPRM